MGWDGELLLDGWMVNNVYVMVAFFVVVVFVYEERPHRQTVEGEKEGRKEERGGNTKWRRK